jgi:RNA polymerase sigma factor (sigma-70 family)
MAGDGLGEGELGIDKADSIARRFCAVECGRLLPDSELKMGIPNAPRTQSPFWWAPDVTKLIADARTNPDSRNRLAELVYRPAFRRLDAWFAAAGLKRLNMQAEEVFDALWARDLATAIEHVTFRDREHFLRIVLLRSRQAAHRLARQIREERTRAVPGEGATAVVDPAEAAEHAEMIGRVLRAMRRLLPPRYEIVNLHFFEGMTIRQMADELKLPRSTVHHELQEALRELREVFAR